MWGTEKLICAICRANTAPLAKSKWPDPAWDQVWEHHRAKPLPRVILKPDLSGEHHILPRPSGLGPGPHARPGGIRGQTESEFATSEHLRSMLSTSNHFYICKCLPFPHGFLLLIIPGKSSFFLGKLKVKRICPHVGQKCQVGRREWRTRRWS